MAKLGPKQILKKYDKAHWNLAALRRSIGSGPALDGDQNLSPADEESLAANQESLAAAKAELDDLVFRLGFPELCPIELARAYSPVYRPPEADQQSPPGCGGACST